VRPRDRNLIEQIEKDALDSSIPLADTLRMLIALGGQTGSTELREWASRELRGYIGSGLELPEYRKPAAIIQINATVPGARITGQQISPRQLPDPVNKHIGEEIPLGQAVGEIEALLEQAKANSGSVKMTLPDAQTVVTLMNHEVGDPYQHITEIYWSLSTPAIQGVLDQMRTTLVELVAEMRAGMPETDELPSGELVDQAVRVVVEGKGHRVNVNTAQSRGGGPSTVHVAPADEGGWTWRRVGAFIVGAATVVGVIVAVLAWQGWGL
jgi:hypothetical protein